MTTRKFIDSTGEEGTRQLCRLIHEYWRKHGHPNISATPVQIRLDHHKSKNPTASVWGIKSNIGPGGFPVGDPATQWVTR